MASFKTHLYAGIFLSGGTVLALQGLGLAPPRQSLALFALGVAGSVLPDIDADLSAPGRAFFGVLGAALAFGWTLPLVGHFGSLELALIWIGLFLAVRFLLFETFARFTVHRGIWHSWLAAAFVSLATATLAHRFLDQPPRTAWAAAGMVGIGYLGHLLLDELSSVDLYERRVRRSFGTAFKPFSLTDPLATLAMGAAVGVLCWLAPPTEGLPPLPDQTQVAAWALRTLEQAGDAARAGLASLRTWLQW